MYYHSMDSVVRACFSDWLLKLGLSSAIDLRATPNSRKLRPNGFPVRYSISKQRNKIKEEAVPDNTKKATEFGLAVLMVNLCLFNLRFIVETGEKGFC